MTAHRSLIRTINLNAKVLLEGPLYTIKKNEQLD